MTLRIACPKVTPAATKRDYRRVAVFIEPPVRRGSRSYLAKTVGDLLDAVPIDCRTGSWWWATDGRFGLRWGSCGRKSCTWCCVDWCTRRVAGAWASWNGRAYVLDLDTEHARETRMLAKAGLVWRGEHATAGALSIPTSLDGRRRVFWPASGPKPPAELGARLLRATKLDAALAEAVRAIPIEEENAEGKSRGPSKHFGWLPRGMSLRTAADRGPGDIAYTTLTERNARARNVSEEQKDAFVEAVSPWS